jgi:hypothetical protein
MKYWDAADGIAAFACVQNTAFLLALLNTDARNSVRAARWASRGSILLFWVVYCVGETACVKTALHLGDVSGTKLLDAWNDALIGRLTAITIFSAIALLALFAPSHETSVKPSRGGNP